MALTPLLPVYQQSAVLCVLVLHREQNFWPEVLGVLVVLAAVLYLPLPLPEVLLVIHALLDLEVDLPFLPSPFLHG